MAMITKSLLHFSLVVCLLQGAFSTEDASEQEVEEHGRRLLQDEVFGLIQNGATVKRGRFPYMSSLRTPEDSHACGGALIDKNWVVTAAHCLDPNAPNGKPLGLNPKVVIGSVFVTEGDDIEGVEVHLGEAIIHPLWDNNLLNGFDIAMIKLPKPSKIEPLKLAAKGTSLTTGTFLSALGWGADGTGSRSTNSLMRASVVFRSNAQCNVEDVWDGKITPEMMCAGGTIADVDAVCTGDSGGPLLVPDRPGGEVGDGDPTLDVLTGITSFSDVARCDVNVPILDSRPVVYTRISEFREWIDDVVKGIEKEISTTASSLNAPNASKTPKAPSTSRTPKAPITSRTPKAPITSRTPVTSTTKTLCKAGIQKCGKSSNDLLIGITEQNDALVEDSVFEGANIEVRDKEGHTPLTLSAMAGDLGFVNFLLEAGANPNAFNVYGENALSFAASYGEIEMMEALLEAGADIDAVDDFGSSPLIVATIVGQVDAVEFLLARGADPTVQNRDGTALEQICPTIPTCTSAEKREIEALLRG